MFVHHSNHFYDFCFCWHQSPYHHPLVFLAAPLDCVLGVLGYWTPFKQKLFPCVSGVGLVLWANKKSVVKKPVDPSVT